MARWEDWSPELFGYVVTFRSADNPNGRSRRVVAWFDDGEDAKTWVQREAVDPANCAGRYRVAESDSGTVVYCVDADGRGAVAEA